MITLQPFAASLQRGSKGDLVSRHTLVRVGAFTFLFMKITQTQPGDADAIRLEGFPNQLAAHAASRIIAA